MDIVDVLERNMKNKKIRVLSIEANGKHFCSGDDLESMGPDGVRFKPLEDGSRMPHHKMIRLIRKIQKPVVALLHGYCLGAGFELALACDLRIASDDLKIGDYRASRAICILSGSSWLLPRIVGFGRATDIIFTGRIIDAEEALNIGLVTKVYPATEFKEKSMEYVRTLASMPTRCLGYNKTMLNYSQYHELFPSMLNEFSLYCKNIATKDFGIGMDSFRKKKEPKFTGR